MIPTIFEKGDNFCDFLFLSQEDAVLPKGVNHCILVDSVIVSTYYVISDNSIKNDLKCSI